MVPKELNRNHKFCGFTPALLAVIALLCGCEPHITVNAPIRPRVPNEFELFYTVLAGNFGDASLCQKISKRSYAEVYRDAQIDFRTERSECYFNAAVETRNVALCDQVEEIVTIPRNQTSISRHRCREAVNARESIGAWPDLYDLNKFLPAMGYQKADAERTSDSAEKRLERQAVDWDSFYSYLAKKASAQERADFIRRAEALPSFAN